MLSKHSKIFPQKGVASWRSLSPLQGRHLGRERIATIGFDDLSGAFDAVGAGAFAIALKLPQELDEVDFEKIRVFKEVSHPLPLIVSFEPSLRFSPSSEGNPSPLKKPKVFDGCWKWKPTQRETHFLAAFLESLALAGVSGVCLNTHSIEIAEESLMKIDAIVRLKNLGLTLFSSSEFGSAE